MTPDDLAHLLDRCGGDLAAWPPGAEQAARRLLSVSPQARAALAAAQALDRLMDATRAQLAPERLAERATARAQEPRRTATGLWTRAAGAAAAAAALSLGLVAGASDRAPTPDQAVSAALGALPEAFGAAAGEAEDAG